MRTLSHPFSGWSPALILNTRPWRFYKPLFYSLSYSFTIPNFQSRHLSLNNLPVLRSPEIPLNRYMCLSPIIGIGTGTYNSQSNVGRIFSRARGCQWAVGVVPSLQYSLPVSRLSPLLDLRRDEHTLYRCVVINAVEVYAQKKSKDWSLDRKIHDAQQRVAAGSLPRLFMPPSLLVHSTRQASHYACS